MKTKNKINGRFFAELHRDVTFKRVAACNSRAAIEPRISIYGNDPKEWANLATWFCKFKVACVDPDTGRRTMLLLAACCWFAAVYLHFGFFLVVVFFYFSLPFTAFYCVLMCTTLA